jgi:hypothetical protein
MRLTLLACLALAAPFHAPAQITGLGAMGDSITDEYAEESYGAYAQNWLEQLRTYRGLPVGPTAAEAGVGSWNEPRREGFEFNWARSGAYTDSLLDAGQHTGVAALAQSGRVSHAVLFIGANDFAPIVGLPYWWIYNGFWGQGTIDDFIDSRIANIREAAETVLASGADLVLISVLDYGLAPRTWQDPSFDEPAKRDRVSKAIATLNDRLDALAQEKQIVMVDFASLGSAIFGDNHNLKEFLLIGGWDIRLWQTDTPGNDNPAAGFVHDGIHPHTTLQAIVANVIAEGLNIGYSASIALFTEEEVLAHAGLEYGGADMLAEQIGAYADYVRDYTAKDCYADFTGDGALDLFDFLAFVNAFNAGNNSADCDASGGLDLFDFLCFTNVFNGGC